MSRYSPKFANIADEFLDLLDTPASYVGEANKFVRVNPGETGLVFSLRPFSESIDFTRNGGTNNQYLKIGGVYSNITPLRVIDDGQLDGISVQNNAVNTFDIEVKINGVTQHTENIIAALGAHAAGLGIVFSAGDLISVYCSGFANSPIVHLSLVE